MTEPVVAPAGVAASAASDAPERLNLVYHVIIGVGVGLVSLLTGFAWPFAIGVGVIVGRNDAERIAGLPRQRGAVQLLRALGLVVGLLFMLFFGAILGGIIALVIVGLVDFSERLTAKATWNDQTIARILVVIVAVLTWLVLLFGLHLNVSINLGSPTTVS